ncbi:MAG: efflux transporter outer membrane subunit [Alphaproteobacteria bacterium]|nr:efflux transporter outer membrane subunit [Alphaproteobacteria bacterium]MBU0795955.1 efflux transporter outer membrane subunit [Alphaproteobacteria bacterium]MBU0886484.1 efflux transporter outer membrane subunit [Alphaproteobacteria bacterium]MBU1812293.1 efflux transporter outer membrane subunit [Alphaproteobacteria bacterium]
MRNPFLALTLAALLGGCTMGPDFTRPAAEMPQQWPGTVIRASQVDPLWWRSYDDMALVDLVNEALAANSDLLVAAARVAEARALAGVSRADRLPTLDVEASGARQRQTDELAVGAPNPVNNFRLAGVLSYELDLWGRLARADEAVRAQLMASEANRDAVRLAVAADVASGYFNLRAIDQQVVITERTLAARQESFELQQIQYTNGVVTELVLRQAESELAAARAQLPALRQQRALQRNALAVLLGRTPRALVEGNVPRGQSIDQLPVPPVVPGYMPSDILDRRPDIQQAEQLLAAANAQIGVAEANFFPRISLTASGGTQSLELGDLFSAGTGIWSLGANLTAPIIDFGRNQSNLDAAEARKLQSYLEYQQTVRTAFREVMDALETQQGSAERLNALDGQVAALDRTFALARERYDGGYTGYIEVLDAQRALFQAELDRVSTQRDRLQASVDLYKALGGGWSADQVAR